MTWGFGKMDIFSSLIPSLLTRLSFFFSFIPLFLSSFLLPFSILPSLSSHASFLFISFLTPHYLRVSSLFHSPPLFLHPPPPSVLPSLPPLPFSEISLFSLPPTPGLLLQALPTVLAVAGEKLRRPQTVRGISKENISCSK